MPRPLTLRRSLRQSDRLSSKTPSRPAILRTDLLEQNVLSESASRQTENVVLVEPAASAAGAGDDVPFFIVGSGRSGTTLLRLFLCGHSRLHVPPETHFIEALVTRLPLAAPLTPAQAAEAVAVIVGHPHWKFMEMPAEALREAVAHMPAPTLADVVAPVYRHHLARAGKPRCGDKTPDYITIVPELAAMYPGARFIHLIRDGRDVTISMNELGWGHAYHGEQFEWTRAIRRGFGYRDSALAPQILEVRYEDLVCDVAGTLRRICDFLGEEFEPAMLERQQTGDTLVAPEWRHIHGKLAKPVTADAVATWRRKLSAAECFLIEASLRRDLERLGYRLRFAGALWRPPLAVAAALLRAAAPLLDRLLPALHRRGYLRRPICL